MIGLHQFEAPVLSNISTQLTSTSQPPPASPLSTTPHISTSTHFPVHTDLIYQFTPSTEHLYLYFHRPFLLSPLVTFWNIPFPSPLPSQKEISDSHLVISRVPFVTGTYTYIREENHLSNEGCLSRIEWHRNRHRKAHPQIRNCNTVLAIHLSLETTPITKIFCRKLYVFNISF